MGEKKVEWEKMTEERWEERGGKAEEEEGWRGRRREKGKGEKAGGGGEGWGRREGLQMDVDG